jgi:hypothetical protein
MHCDYAVGTENVLVASVVYMYTGMLFVGLNQKLFIIVTVYVRCFFNTQYIDLLRNTNCRMVHP